MRTYSHAALTWTAARFVSPSGSGAAAWAACGAALPDLPALAGAAWLALGRRRPDRAALSEDVCARRVFAGPDAALHSSLPVGAWALACWALRRAAGGRGLRGPFRALLAGWAGHVLLDALTHAEDARPILWPASGRRFGSPVSYWDPSRHGRLFAVAEHGALLLAAAWALSRRSPTPSGGPG